MRWRFGRSCRNGRLVSPWRAIGLVDLGEIDVVHALLLASARIIWRSCRRVELEGF